MQSPLVRAFTPASELRRRNETLLENGARLIETLPEHFPDGTDPRLARLYEDIRDTLHVPVVNFMFRLLANYPDWLERSWAGLRDPVLDEAVERAAGEISGMADALTAGEREVESHPPLVGIEAEVRGYTDTIAYVMPKLLLIATALAGTFERQPRYGGAGRVWPRGRSACLRLENCERRGAPARGVAPWTVALPLVDLGAATPRVAAVLEDVQQRHGHPGATPFYRGLANWPSFLVRLWAAVRPVVGSERYLAWRDVLVLEAEQRWRAVEIALPVRRPAGARDIEAVVAFFRLRLIPELLLDVTMMRTLLAARLPQGLAASH